MIPTVVSNILCAHTISNISLLAVEVQDIPSRKSSLLQRSDTLPWRRSLLVRPTQQVRKRVSLNTLLASHRPGLVASLRPTRTTAAALNRINYLLSRHMLRIMRAIPLQLRRNLICYLAMIRCHQAYAVHHHSQHKALQAEGQFQNLQKSERYPSCNQR